MSRQPTKQLSLQSKRAHPTLPRAPVRRQKSADDCRRHESTPLLFHSMSGQQQLRSRREKTASDRPKVRIAWSSTEDTRKVEVVASRIGTSSHQKDRMLASTGCAMATPDKATILYSRQELAERLRLAWKQREANKSNIDIFLAHETTADDSRCESRLSTASCDAGQSDAKDNSRELRVIVDARAKRASYQAGNAAFNGTAQRNSSAKDTGQKLEKNDKPKERVSTPDVKSKRTNSAPPLQRRQGLPGGQAAANIRPKVSIVIETPKIVAARETSSAKESKTDRKVDSQTLCEDSSNIRGSSASLCEQPAVEKPKTGTKKRARSGKRRDELGKKAELSKSNPDVVTMVSLVSDADSESENEDLRDDKLVRQLRSNLPTTPIIKNSTTTAVSAPGTLDSSLMPRRILKSVSFQQNSVDDVRPRALDKSNEGLSKILLQQAQIQQIIRGSSLSPEVWSAETCSPVPTGVPSAVVSPRNYWKTSEEESVMLTDREKRCLVVPIGDPRDKKRKLVVQRAKTLPSGYSCDDGQSTLQIQTKDSPNRQTDNNPPLIQAEAISLQVSVSKLIRGDSFEEASIDLEVDGTEETAEPRLRTTKEKECWHLYRRMCDKGVCVSFDTVLRGMLTPTEYRLRRRETT